MKYIINSLNNKLKPCPFCGRTEMLTIDSMEDYLKDDIYRILCNIKDDGCGSSSGWYYSEEEAIRAWNTRISDFSFNKQQADNVEKMLDKREMME